MGKVGGGSQPPTKPVKQEAQPLAEKKKRRGNAAALAHYREQKRAAEGNARDDFAHLAQTVTAPPEEELSDDLKAVFLTLKQANQQKNADAALEAIQASFAKLDPDTLSRVVNTPMVQEMIEKLAGAIRKHQEPGEAILDKDGRIIGMVPWREADILAKYPMVKWTPAETMPVIFNGHAIQVYAWQEIETPSIFFDIYKQHLEATRAQGEDNARALREHFGPGISLETGWKGTEGAA